MFAVIFISRNLINAWFRCKRRSGSRVGGVDVCGDRLSGGSSGIICGSSW